MHKIDKHSTKTKEGKACLSLLADKNSNKCRLDELYFLQCFNNKSECMFHVVVQTD